MNSSIADYVKIGEVSNIIDSLHETPQYSQNGYPMIRVTDIKYGFLKLDNTLRVDEEVYNKFTRKYKPQRGDILISRVGSYNGVTTYVNTNKKICLGQNTALINPINIDSLFLYYALQSKNVKHQIESFSVGSAKKTISLKSIKEIKIPYPDIKYQQQIGRLLYEIDSKIETNNRINKNLEEMAQAIFKQWFVDFEFPNEDGKPYKSSGGEISIIEGIELPENWELGSLGKSSITELIKTGINKFDGEKIYIATADVENTNITNISTRVLYNKKPSRANMQPIENSVWFAKMKDSRKLIVLDTYSKSIIDGYVLSTGFAGIKCSKNSLYYMWCYIMSDMFDTLKNSLCNGTTMQAINNENINKIIISIPENSVLVKFNDICKPIFNKVHFNYVENIRLEKLRDELLEKLMIGEIRVSVEN